MDFESLNNRGKEAWAKSRIDLGNGILKAIFIGFMLLPATLILKYGFEGKEISISFFEVLKNLPDGAFLTILVSVGLLSVWGIWLVSSGIKMMDRIDE